MPAATVSPPAAGSAKGGDAQQRVAVFNDEATRKKFGDNQITTGKYSLASFVPVSLFEQCVGARARARDWSCGGVSRGGLAASRLRAPAAQRHAHCYDKLAH